MRVNRLILSNFRGQRDLTLEFRPGFNLIVGVNGAGKTTLLEALRILLARALPSFSPAKPFLGIGLNGSDITIGEKSSNVSMHFNVGDVEYFLSLGEQVGKFKSTIDQETGYNDISGVDLRADGLRQPQNRKVPRLRKGDLRLEGTIRGQTTEMPEARGEIFPSPRGDWKLHKNFPLVLHFSVRRAHATDKIARNQLGSPGYRSIFDVERGLELGILSLWWKGRENLAAEDPNSKSARQLATIKNALNEMLPELTNWRVSADQLYVDKLTKVSRVNESGERLFEQRITTIPAKFLSDGERSIFGLCVDIAHRLALLNEHSDTPLVEGKGVVLIDEIDLHLHPKWQRSIVKNLRQTFPGIQFICTSHSPQLIGQIASEDVALIGAEEGLRNPSQSFGMDSNWILRHIMGSDDRDPDIANELDGIFVAIEGGDFDTAQHSIDGLRTKIGEHPDLVEAQALVSRYSRFSKSDSE